MGDQSPDRNVAVADRGDDMREVLVGRVPAGEEGHFAAVEIGIGEGDRILDDPDQHIASAMADEVEAPFHGALAAGRVEDDAETVAAGEGLDRFERIAGGRKDVRAGDRRRRLGPPGIAVENRHPGSGEAREQRDAEPDRPGADDQHIVARRHAAAADRVRPDRQKLDRGAFVGGESVRRNEIPRRQRQKLGHAAVLMNAEHRQGDAAIGLARPAGDAMAAGEIRVDDADPADRDGGSRRGVDHLDGELVAHDPRIVQEGMLALVDVIVGAADADAARTNQGESRIELRQRPAHEFEPAGLDADEGIDQWNVASVRLIGGVGYRHLGWRLIRR